MTQILFTLLFAVAFGGYAYWTLAKRKHAVAHAEPAVRRFFERTEYRFIDIPDGPLDVQVRRNQDLMAQLMKGAASWEQHWVRNFHGVAIHFHSYIGAGAKENSRVWSCRWLAPLTTPPAVLWEVADKKLVGARKAIREVFANSCRTYEPTYSEQVEIGDTALDARFFFYTTNPEGLRKLLLGNSRLKELLLGTVETCLFVGTNDVSFSNPFQKNLQAGLGGSVGQMAMGFDLGKAMELSVPVHDSMAELLAVIVQAGNPTTVPALPPATVLSLR